MRWGALLVCAVALVASPGEARADDAARKAFERGKELRDQGDCTRAIPEFERSIAAERSIGAFYNLGYCHEQLGRRQAAYDAYKQAQQLASGKKDDRVGEISGAIASLLETSHIRLALPQPLPNGLQIRVDDELVPSTAYQAETVIFTSKQTRVHAVVVTAPGYEERRESVETKQIKPIELQRQSDKPLPPPSTGAPAKQESAFTTQHWVGIGVAGAGLVTGAIALGFLVDYVTDRSDLKQEATDKGCTLDTQLSCRLDVSDTTRSELISKNNKLERAVVPRTAVLGAIGGGLILTGLVVFLVAPRTVITAPAKTGSIATLRVVPHVGPQAQSLSLVGTF